ncbi:hypothetical protein HPB50_019586 [Hyalomma asiaticum]|uniref:Uncharacterized protein n=1 Tax=Hyalomma asiaticum TaxID=266040 RepID=A0ACB7TKD2_HYAAI|nr:hypothetical protein HPB50_019586 [Hyalomma asiaticum]
MQQVAAIGRSLVTVWGEITKDGFGPLVRVHGRITAESYCSILDDMALPFLLGKRFQMEISSFSKTTPKYTRPSWLPLSCSSVELPCWNDHHNPQT